MKYKKYPSYKDSGVEWLDEIPTEWVVSRNKIAFQFVKSLVGKESNNYQLLMPNMLKFILIVLKPF